MTTTSATATGATRTGAPRAAGVHVSALDLFSVGIGPSSSHTVGPMRAARAFVEELRATGGHRRTAALTCVLHGSLAATGLGHGTPDAVLAGLRGHRPERCDPDDVRGAWAALTGTPGAPVVVDLGDGAAVGLGADALTFAPFDRQHGHPNALTLRALDAAGAPVLERTYLSVGGGFVARADGVALASSDAPNAVPDDMPLADPGPVYRTADELLALCAAAGTDVAGIAWACETARRPAAEVAAGLDAIWAAMDACITAGMTTDGPLPGRLGVVRRAAAARRALEARADAGGPHLLDEWLTVFALAVNEENAAGGRVVTAPTNGAAGVLPAVLRYLVAAHGLDRAAVHRFLLTATAVGSLIKANASISGAEAGCQGEVGSACAMAAAGCCAVLGGTPGQVENAAEIAMEHHLGLTCDPVGGLVQIPCIERNAVAASTAMTAARIALLGDGRHVVSLDTVIETMRQTGADMSSRYKETSEAGLAVNVVEC